MDEGQKAWRRVVRENTKGEWKERVAGTACAILSTLFNGVADGEGLYSP
jgi:hypothetical protein